MHLWAWVSVKFLCNIHVFLVPVPVHVCPRCSFVCGFVCMPWLFDYVVCERMAMHACVGILLCECVCVLQNPRARVCACACVRLCDMSMSCVRSPFMLMTPFTCALPFTVKALNRLFRKALVQPSCC